MFVRPSQMQKKIKVSLGVCVHLIVIILFLSSCDWHNRKRSPGYVRLGPISEHMGQETFNEKHNILVRRDQFGWWAMSTLCTYDLSPLRMRVINGRREFISPSTGSVYDIKGRVLKGPSRADLPYYELRAGSKVYGGKVDTLFVFIGKEVPENWRLSIAVK